MMMGEEGGSNRGKERREFRGEGRRVHSLHAPGISYLKFSLSAPRRPFHSANKDAQIRAHLDEGSE